jgi:hypothetical protein
MPVEVAVGEGYRGASGEHLFVGNCLYLVLVSSHVVKTLRLMRSCECGYLKNIEPRVECQM